MSSSSPNDYIAIDTNVFEHLLSPQENAAGHINRVLSYLYEQQTIPLVDEQDRIPKEYNHRLSHRIADVDDARNEIFILRYWILLAEHQKTSVVGNDALMQTIKQIIIESGTAVDRIFVYVAFRIGKTLITNDRRNIVDGPVGESGDRRHRLLNDTKKLCPAGIDVQTSIEAYAKIP